MNRPGSTLVNATIFGMVGIVQALVSNNPLSVSTAVVWGGTFAASGVFLKSIFDRDASSIRRGIRRVELYERVHCVISILFAFSTAGVAVGLVCGEIRVVLICVFVIVTSILLGVALVTCRWVAQANDRAGEKTYRRRVRTSDA